MCDACNLLKNKTIKTDDKDEEQNVLKAHTIYSCLKEHTVQIKLCQEHDRIFFLKGERGFLRVYPLIETAIRQGLFKKAVKD